MTKFLDQEALSHYTGKVKEYVDNKVRTIDLSLYAVVDALPTTGIKASKIYLVKSNASETQNIYVEYIYTGDTTATYDVSKWEKLGEYKATVDLSPYLKVTEFKAQKGAANGLATLDANSKVADSHLWDATSSKHGLMTAADKTLLDALPETLGNDLANGKYEDVLQFGGVYEKNPSDTIENTSPSANFTVVYIPSSKTFMAKTVASSSGSIGVIGGAKLHANWNGRSSFGAFGANGVAPSEKKIYINTEDGTIYYFNGTELKPNMEALTTAEIDNLFNNEQ